MTEFPATTVAAYAMCPRQARFRGTEPWRLENDVFGAIVRRTLQRAADSRIAKEAYDLGYVLDNEMLKLGVRGDRQLFERARTVAGFGLRTLFEYHPVIAEAPFGATVAGVRVHGTIDLVAEREDDSPVVFAFKTSEIPHTTFAIWLALAKGGVADTFPNASYVVLSLDENGAALSEPELPNLERIESYVRDALASRSDEPRTGPYCVACAFLESCPEGRARAG